METIEKGMTMGPYKLEHELGAGGMGQVWMAYHEPMDRHVALKILSPGLTDDSEFVTRFQQEVKLAGKLHHAHIIPAYEAGVDHGMHYLSMAYVNGIEVEERIKSKGPLSSKEALKIAYHIASALEYAWDNYKILHRDIKPSNIMVDADQKAYLMDMGISKCVNDSANITLAGMVVGTPNYMSPEQATGSKEIDCRADIYSLGASLYHMLTGQTPFDSSSTIHVLQKVLSETLPPPREINSEIPSECADLLNRMLEKNPDDRYQTWDEVKKDIYWVSKGKPIRKPSRRSSSRSMPASVEKKKVPMFILGLISLTLLLIIMIIAGLIYLVNRNKTLKAKSDSVTHSIQMDTRYS